MAGRMGLDRALDRAAIWLGGRRREERAARRRPVEDDGREGAARHGADAAPGRGGATGASRAAQVGRWLFGDQASSGTSGAAIAARLAHATAVSRENSRPVAWVAET